MRILLFSSRVQQPPQQPSLCPLGSPRTNSSSPAKVTQLQTWIRASDCLEVLWNLNSHKQALKPLACRGLSGQILQVVRAANGAQYIIPQPQQQILLQQQMQPGGVQAPVIQQVTEVLDKGVKDLKCSMAVGIVGPSDASLICFPFFPSQINFFFSCFILLDFVKTFSANLYL